MSNDPTHDRWRRVWELFEGVLDQAPARRGPWLAASCEGDESLRREVERMLSAHERGPGILDRPAADLLDGDPAGGQHGAGSAELTPVGPFTLETEIGRGGMGLVYKALDSRLGRAVALKLLPRHLGADTDARMRFIEEARAASALDHPRICTIYEIGESDRGELYIAMAYYAGPTVAQLITRGPLPISQAVRLARAISEGLASAHRAGIVHRDIKPTNVILTDDGEVKLLDFGVAKLERSAVVTQPGIIVGTLAYMAPEQITGDVVDHRADLWSLGVVLFEMLTGRRPFEGASQAGVLHAVVHGQPPRALELRSDVPPALSAIVSRLLEKTPGLRYPSASALLEDLDRLGVPADGRPGEQSRPDTRAHGAVATAVPASLTSFVGRDEDLLRLRQLLQAARLVTLTGAAGAGKTRLAHEVARAAAPGYAAVHLVSLASVSDAELVIPSIAQSLGMATPRAADLVPAVAEALGERRVLLVLDNCEQVAAAAPRLAALLERAPGLTLLATSRVPLRITGEQEFPVAPLAVPSPAEALPAALAQSPSVALFVERARAVLPGFTLDEANAAAVGELCRGLDGLPLAIELAAARMRVLDPHAIVGHLGRRLDVLKGGPRDRPARHQTLRQAVGWSYDLLSASQQRLFRHLAAFQGGCTLDAVEATAGRTAPGEAGENGETAGVLDDLEALVEHSLIARDAGTGPLRFRMLETIRVYADERLQAAGEREDARRAHALYFVAFAEQAEPHLTTTEQRRWLDALEAEHDNFRAALAWSEGAPSGEGSEAGEIGLRLAAALWRLWISRCYIDEGRQHLERHLASGVGGARLRARALIGLGTLAQSQGDNEAAGRALEEALELWRREGDRRGIAAALLSLAWVDSERCRLEDAEARSREGLAAYEQLGEKRGLALAQNNLGWIALYRGEHREARKYFEESLALRQAIGDTRGVAFALTNLAWVEQYAGEVSRAERLLEDAFETAAAVQDQVLHAWSLTVQGQAAQAAGEHDRAAAVFDRALPVARKGGNRSVVAIALTGAAASAAVLGDLDRGRRWIDEAVATWRTIGSTWGLALALIVSARLASRGSDFRTAARWCRESLSLVRQLGDRHNLAQGLELHAAIEAGSDPAAAARSLATAGRLRDRLPAPAPPDVRADMERLASDLRNRLGAEAFDREWAAGTGDEAR